MQEKKLIYTVYSAGPLFSQHDLTSNVLMKRAVGERSGGKYKLALPQSKEKREPNEANIAAFIRNYDLLQVVECDLVLARFDGVELDPGTVVEFMLAKFLGKGTLILRSDSRRQGSNSIDEPYNLMVKNWPRTVEVHLDALMNNYHHIQANYENLPHESSLRNEMEIELRVAEQGMAHLADRIIAGLDEVLELPSPYPLEYREAVYRQTRFMLGDGFQKLLTEKMVEEVLLKLKEKGVL